MKANFVLLVALVAITGNAMAAKPWSFAGIHLGAPLVSSSLPDCPTPVGAAMLTWTPPTAICVTSISAKTADGGQIADLGGLTALHWQETYGGWVSIWNGNVTAIRIHLDHDVFDNIKRILVARYGKPSSVTQGEVTSNAGAIVASSRVTWREDGNTVELTERCERIDRSCVDVVNDAMMRDRIAAKKHTAAADASIL